MPDARDLLSAYRKRVGDLRRGAGPVGALFAPLELSADLLDQVFARQQELETQVAAALLPLDALLELARDAPATLRSQAKAFEAASVSFHQAAEVMNLQADLLERTGAAFAIPRDVLKSLRAPNEPSSPDR